MAYIFSECSNLKELDLKSFNTSNVSNMTNMFYRCNGLKNLELGDNFNTTSVTNMEWMFKGCSNLENSYIRNFNTSNVPNK